MSELARVEVQTTTPVRDDVGWDASVHEVRVNVGVWGVQTIRVGSHHGDAPRGHLTVAVGQTITYLHDAHALNSMVDAWTDALIMSERMRLTGELPPHAWTKPAPLTVGVSVRLEGPVKHDLRGIPAGASPDGHAHVVLHLGRLVHRIYDNAAMWSYTDAWSAALDAGVMFGGGGHAFRERLDRTRERAQRYEAPTS